MPKKTLGLVLLLMLVPGCSKRNAESKSAANSPPPKPPAVHAEKRAALPWEFKASRYSDSARWQNGINRRQRSQFLYTIAKDQPTPFLPGCRLEFAAAGAATVLSVFRQEGPAHASIFVTVDLELDPERDGHPNPVRMTGFSLQAVNYSKQGLWDRGISLREPGLFLVLVDRKAAVPFAAGDRLRFAAAGEAAIVKVARQEGADRFLRVFVTVDRPLDPLGDGHPHPIRLEF